MNELHRITVDAGVCGGRPTIRGLRIRVRFGNVRRQELLRRLDALWPQVLEALARGEGLIELI
jgi:hypothetical protein